MKKRALAGLAIVSTVLAFGVVQAETRPNPDRQNDPLLAETTRLHPNRESAIINPTQEDAVRTKLEKLYAKTGKRPNIVIVLMDDVGWGDWGSYGGGASVGAPTPNLDRLAAGGLRLTSAYSQPSCTPTRASLMTGRLPVRSGLLRPMLPGEGGSDTGGLNGEVTLAAILKEVGYSTHAIGKWHLGEAEDAQPQNVGFDDYFGILTSSDDYTAWREPWRNPDIANDPVRYEWASQGEVMAVVEGVTGEAARPVFEIDMETISLVDEKLTQRAVKIIRESKTSKSPFLIYLGTRGAHNDNYPHPDFRGKSPGKYPYKDVMIELDYRVGEIVRALEEAGQDKNTLLIITSDNGPFAEAFPDMGFTPFRAAKGTSYEGGVRVPFIAYWPGTIEPGQVSDGLFDLMDLFLTSLTVAGASDLIPQDRYIDSIDQSGFLLSPAGQSARKAVYFWVTNKLSAVRVGEFKYFRRWQTYLSTDTWPASSPFQSAMESSAYGGKMYDLYIDPKEEHALAPLKQPQIPLLSGALRQHLKSFEDHPARVPIE